MIKFHIEGPRPEPMNESIRGDLFIWVSSLNTLLEKLDQVQPQRLVRLQFDIYELGRGLGYGSGKNKFVDKLIH